MTITGTNFVSGAAVTLGGASLTSIVYVDSTHITGKTPSRPAGSLQDVSVTNPGGAAAVVAAMLSQGWFSDFSDVPQAESLPRRRRERFPLGGDGGLRHRRVLSDDCRSRAPRWRSFS